MSQVRAATVTRALEGYLRERASAPHDLIGAAVRQLTREGWTVCAVHADADAPWHVAARRGARWRVVQVLAPATGSHERQAGRLRLGEAARIPAALGRMEQWLAHVQPGGHLTFGRDALCGADWGHDRDLAHLRLRLGLDDLTAPPAW